MVATMPPSSIKQASDAGSLAALVARAQAEGGRGAGALPPVDDWNPPDCGAIDMEIRPDGRWFYLGTPITRQPLVRLFSTVLRKDEDGETYLVTPVEKVRIRVADAAFLAVEMVLEDRGDGCGPRLVFRTNVGDVVEAGPAHPLRFSLARPDAPLKPYLHVRGRLEALLTRAVTHELMALGEEVPVDGEATFAVRSGETLFPVMSMAALDRELSP